MEGFNFNKKIEGSVEIMNADDLLELEKEDPTSYIALMKAIEQKEEEDRLSIIIEEGEEANKDYYKKMEYAKEAGFLKQEDIDKVEIDNEGVARYLGMTIDQLKDFDKENRSY